MAKLMANLMELSEYHPWTLAVRNFTLRACDAYIGPPKQFWPFQVARVLSSPSEKKFENPAIYPVKVKCHKPRSHGPAS